MGCPIKGDVKYGFDRTNEDGSIHLHARSIQFMHPVKGEEIKPVSYTHLRAHETVLDLVCRLLLEKKT